MQSTNVTLDLLARAVEVSALRQSVYTSNIANAGVEGYRRMEVSFDRELERVAVQMANAQRGEVIGSSLTEPPVVISTDAAVKQIGRAHV